MAGQHRAASEAGEEPGKAREAHSPASSGVRILMLEASAMSADSNVRRKNDMAGSRNMYRNAWFADDSVQGDASTGPAGDN